MTPAIDSAKRAGIEFRVHAYKHDPNTRSYGLEAAEALGIPIARVFKTLIAQLGDSGRMVCIVPVSAQLDLKACAALAGVKKALMAEPREAERCTGYLVGGISPLGQKKALPTVIHQSALEFASVFVSAGRRGLEMELAPRDLVTVTKATVAAVAR